MVSENVLKIDFVLAYSAEPDEMPHYFKPCLRNYLLGLSLRLFRYCNRAVKALLRLYGCTCSSEHLLFDNAIYWPMFGLSIHVCVFVELGRHNAIPYQQRIFPRNRGRVSFCLYICHLYTSVLRHKGTVFSRKV